MPLAFVNDLLIDPFATESMRAGALAAIAVGGLCGVVGTFVVIRGSALMAESFAHGVLPGVAVAVLITGTGSDPGQAAVLLGAVAGAALTVGLTVTIAQRSGLREDTATAVTFAFMLALGVMLISATDLDEHDLADLLFGDVLAIEGSDLPLIGALCALAALAVRFLYRPIVLVAFDPRRAASMGLSVRAVELAVSMLLAATVVIGFRVVGSLLVFGLLVAPPAAAAMLTSRIPSMMALAAAIAAAAAPIGMLVGWHLDVEMAPAIVLVAVGACLTVLTLRPAGR